MPITKQAQTALEKYLVQADAGNIQKTTIYQAVQLTSQQQAAIEQHLRLLWNNDHYICPHVLDLKPMHGYQSRVMKDRFSSADYLIWIAEGCSEQSQVEIDDRQRPRLSTGLRLDFVGSGYVLHVPIRSDARGIVYIDDVIPKGLESGTAKRNSPLG